MSRQGDSRARLVAAANDLLSRQGYAATVVKDIATVASAPMGSFYYHFPGGKEQLGAEAVRYGTREIGEVFARAMAPHDDAGDAVAACPLALAERLERAGWADGCPVASTALETVGRSDALQAAAGDAFTAWCDVIAEHLRRCGLAPEAADDLAHTTVALIEGAEMIARVRGSREPLDRAAATLRTLANGAIGANG
ncbi:TetR/AcrR family transcriptional regulator [Pseudonocardia acaciae]|uniref:TetR/AcrR family transcriptional regulator n=1 Tax=Pseudonocardia acaciae TaxID=551276 RepID=UPI00048E7DD1|nr:TetR/AcrR family transcriptional regulator [Pseudonocardia acaciae]